MLFTQRMTAECRILFLVLFLLSGMTFGDVLIQKPGSRFIKLTNKNLSITLDSRGRIVALTNVLTGKQHTVQSEELIIKTDKEQIYSSQMDVQNMVKTGNEVQVKLSSPLGDATIYYLLGEEWVEKWVDLKFKQDTIVQQVTLGQRSYSPAFIQIVFHDDGTFYKVPTNLYLRDKKGGWFTGIEYPFFQHDKSAFSSSLYYTVNMRIPAGQTFTTEKEFLGAYKLEGLICRKQLHWRGVRIAQDSNLWDWGEIWAMRRFLEYVCPPITDCWGGDRLLLNGRCYDEDWTVITLPETYPIITDRINRSVSIGIDVFWAAGGFWNFEGWGVNCNVPVTTYDSGPDWDFKLNDYAKTLLDYMKEAGLQLNSDCCGQSQNHPEWLVMHADGTRGAEKCLAHSRYQDGIIEACSKAIGTYDISDGTFGNVIYIWDFHSVLLDDVHGSPAWNFGRDWDSSMLGDPRNWTCYDPNHSHLPGFVQYGWYKGVMRIFRELRARHPLNALVMSWGVRLGGPWVLKDLTHQENIYENWRVMMYRNWEDPNVVPESSRRTAADDLRFQAWFCQNYRFIPNYKNFAQLFLDRREDPDWMYSLMSCLSIGTPRIFVMDLPLPDDEVVPLPPEWQEGWARDPYYVPPIHEPAFGPRTGRNSPAWFPMSEVAQKLKHWKAWGNKNLKYLLVKRDLFGMPLRANGIDGSAHIIGDRGYLFLFNPTVQPHAGSIPLDEKILLTKGEAFRVDMLYPSEGTCYGSFQQGENLIVEISPRSAYLLEVKPYSGPTLAKIKVTPGVDIQPAFEVGDAY